MRLVLKTLKSSYLVIERPGESRQPSIKDARLLKLVLRIVFFLHEQNKCTYVNEHHLRSWSMTSSSVTFPKGPSNVHLLSTLTSATIFFPVSEKIIAIGNTILNWLVKWWVLRVKGLAVLHVKRPVWMAKIYLRSDVLLFHALRLKHWFSRAVRKRRIHFLITYMSVFCSAEETGNRASSSVVSLWRGCLLVIKALTSM